MGRADSGGRPTGAVPAEGAPGPAPSGRVGRDETEEERLDRNWVELLQEMRVMQVGVQIFTGFLLTLPFQPRFRNLDTFDVVVYLAIVAMSVLSMGLFVAPVSMHRIVFRRHRRPELVAFGDRTARLGIGLLAVLFSGAVLLVTDIVVGRVFAVIAALVILGALTTLWFLIPHMVARRSGPAD